MEEEEGEREMWMRRKEEFGKMGFGGGRAGWVQGGETDFQYNSQRQRVDPERLAVGPSIAYGGAKSGTAAILRDLGKLSGLGTQGGRTGNLTGNLTGN